MDTLKGRLTTGVLGTLLIGIAGSALWEIALKPIYSAGRNLVLSIMSLGLDSVRNSAYAEAANGFHEHAATTIVSMASSFSFGIAVSGLIMSVAMPKQLERIAEVAAEGGLALRARREMLMRQMRILLFVLVLIVGFIAGESMRANYATQAVTYFTQLDAIAAPFVSPEQRTRWRSAFAQVRTKADYLALVAPMKHIAEQNRQRVPEFAPW